MTGVDRLRTLLLSRTTTVVLDPDLVANAATRPSRDVDVERFEDELAQLGFVMSLDLAMTVRRLPHQASQELKTWMVATLAKTLGAHRPHVPLFRQFPAGVPADTRALYLRRMLSWLFTRPEQPCPWCGQIKTVGALDPCGHLVCRSCWDLGSYAGCPICHRRIAVEPFLSPPEGVEPTEEERVQHERGQLRLVDLAFDAVAVARDRFERLLARATPLSKEDREEIETVIDVIGPKAAIWMPPAIAVKETMAIVVARFWMVSPDRTNMVKATLGHLRTATDVLRVAAVLMGADPALVEPIELASIGRGLRRAVLQALDRLPAAQLLEDVARHARLWKRVGEVLHPFELAAKFPTAALAFAALRETDLTTLPDLRAHAGTLGISLSDDGSRIEVRRWAGPVEAALRAGDARAAIARLAERPGDLLRRADHVVRVSARDPAAFEEVLAAIRKAVPRGAPNTLLSLAAHARARTRPWPRRVVFPKGEVLKAWGMPDTRPPLSTDAIGAIVDGIRGELLARAEKRKPFARAVIDRALGDLLVPIGERSAAKSRVAWPRGSEAMLPSADAVRLFLHWEEPPRQRVDLDLSVAFYDAGWRAAGKCDFRNLVVGDRAAVHSGDLTSAPPPLGASEFIDLDLPALAALGIRYAVMVVFSYNAIPFERLTHGFAGLMARPADGGPFDPRAVMQRFDLSGASQITVPLTLDLEALRLRWLDVHVKGRNAFHEVGGYNAALAHIGRDFEDFAGTGARPTMWDLAAIHATARANVIYIRERDGTVCAIRRREGETSLMRLARVYENPEPDSQLSRIPHADAPTWFAVMRDDLAIPKGSAGYVLDARGGDGLSRLTAADLVAELAVPKS